MGGLREEMLTITASIIYINKANFQTNRTAEMFGHPIVLKPLWHMSTFNEATELNFLRPNQTK